MGTEQSPLTVEQVLDQMAGRLTKLENEVIRLRNENNRKDDQISELRDQLAGTTGPSMTMGAESFIATLKALFEQKESKVHVPEPHDWEGD